jgi:hypothetical protein
LDNTHVTININETIITGNSLLTAEIAQMAINRPAFFNDRENTHWFFDFQVGPTWVSSKHIEGDFSRIDLELFQL